MSKVSIFFVATIIFQPCLNPPGHGVHQSFTGCHWSLLPLLHDDITELVDVRDLALETWGPVAEERGSCSASVCHSTCWHSWFPQWTVAPHTRQHSCSPRPWHSPCMTVGKTHLSLYSSPGYTHLTPSKPNKFILVSSDHRTWFQ